METSETKTKQFMGLLVPNQRQILAYILCLVPNRSDAEDILQETLSIMWDKFNEYQEGTNFFAWGIGIARNMIYSHYKRNRNNRLEFKPEIEELLQKEIESTSMPDLFQEQMEALKQCLKKMSDREKRYLSLRFTDNLTYQGIAEKFGISMQAVYKAISQIQFRLAKCVRITLEAEGQ